MLCYILRLSLQQSQQNKETTGRATTAELYPGRDTFVFDQGHVTKNQLIKQLRSQGPLLLSPHGERERDPGLVWSRVPWTIDIMREGSFDFNILLTIFLSTSKEGYLESRSISTAIRHNVRICFSVTFTLQSPTAVTLISILKQFRFSV